jgi:hypothetical protein
MDEGAGLAAGAMHGERILDRRLHQEAIEQGAIVIRRMYGQSAYSTWRDGQCET